jgi:uncharacterized glyoxalase superfamily protein PhnB
MRVVVAWEGYSTNRFATPTDKNGLTWQLASQFEKGNGNLRSSIGELTKFLTWYKTTQNGKRNHIYPFKKRDKFVAVKPGFEWIRDEASVRSRVQ